MAKDVRNAIPHGAALLELRYILRMGVTDSLGRRHKFMTGPANSGGVVNYFESLAELRRYINQVHEIRRMQKVTV